jgi:diguanylate cyclase (GGDEF)-like protein
LPYVGEEIFVRKDGSSFIAEIASVPMFSDGRNVSVVTIFRDITERKQTEEQLLLLCNTDPLTKAFNRRYFLSVLDSEVQRAKRYAGPFSLVMCDVNHFKMVNDTFGHKAGDWVLQGIVAFIQARIRGADLFARWGGEEFVLLLTNTTLADAVPLVENIRKSLQALDFGEVGSITVSFGVTAFGAEDSVDTLLSRADKLLYAAKAAGRNCVKAG